MHRQKNTAKRNMSSAVCASSMYSRLCMKMLSFLFVRTWAMLRILYLYIYFRLNMISHSIFVPFVSIFIQSLCCVCYVYHTCYLSLCFCSYITLSLYLYSPVVMYPYTIRVTLTDHESIIGIINIWIPKRLFFCTALS